MSQHAIKLVPASVIPPPLSWKSSSVFPLFSFDFNFFFFFYQKWQKQDVNSHLHGWFLVNIFSALFSVTLHYATKKPVDVNRKSLETVLWAMATGTQLPLLGGASWTAAWRQFVRGSPERDFESWLVCRQQGLRGKWKDWKIFTRPRTHMNMVLCLREWNASLKKRRCFHLLRCLVTTAGS